MRIGGTKPIRVNARFIAATNQDLEQKVKKGLFREDLYYRLNIVPIFIPPLRERQEDIPILLAFFLQKFNQKYGLSKSFSPEVVSLLQKYSWPGNVRELKNIVERLILISNQEIIHVGDLPEHIITEIDTKIDTNETITFKLKSQSLKDLKEELEITVLKEAINKYDSIRKIAKVLGLSHTSVIKKIRKYSLI